MILAEGARVNGEAITSGPHTNNTYPSMSSEIRGFCLTSTAVAEEKERGEGEGRRRRGKEKGRGARHYLGLRDWRPSSILLAVTRRDTRPHKLALIIITKHDSHVYHSREGESERACRASLVHACARARRRMLG